MRRLLGILFGVGTGLCILWRYHKPERARIAGTEKLSLGGFRCVVCEKPGLTLDDFVPEGDAGYVRLDRPTYERLRGSVERDSYRHEH